MAQRLGRQPYRNPLRGATITAARVDQGVDYEGSGPLYAIGPGVIEQVYNSGWPGGTFIAERLTGGALAGQYTYTAEDITPSVSVGQRVTAGTKIGDLRGGMEIGFAAPPPNLGQALAYIKGESNYTGDPGAHPTPEGRRMNRLIAGLGGLPGVLPGGRGGTSAPVGGSSSGSLSSASAGGILSTFEGLAIAVPVVLGALALGVWGLARATGVSKKIKQTGEDLASNAASAAKVAAL